MNDYKDKNEVALWKVENRQSDKHPNLKGNAMVDGVAYWASAWTNKGDGNQPIVKISLTPKDERVDAPKAVVKEIQLDDDLPF